MRKVFAIIALAATLLSLLCGCGAGEEAPTTAPLRSGLTPGEFIGNLEEMLEPIADQYELVLGRRTVLDDGTVCQVATVEETIIGNSCSLYIYSQEEDVEMIILEGKKRERTNLDFAVLSFYIYESTELPDMDADAFYDEFKLISPEPDGFMRIGEWLVGARFTETRLTFSVSFSPD